MTKSITVRRREQRERQKTYRDQQRELRRPTRDDVARVLLWRTMRNGLKADASVLNWLHDRIVRDLVDQGFDEHQADLAFEDLIDRYGSSSTPPFRRKVHLR